MYIVAIAWLYVIVVMAVTASDLTAGLMTVVWYGVAPLVLLPWLAGAAQRRRHRASGVAPDEESHQGDRTDAQ